MQVEVDVTAHLKALVWVENETIVGNSGFVEPPCVDKIQLSELTPDSLFFPVSVLGLDGIHSKSRDVCH